MDINSLASEFGSAGKSVPIDSGVDVHGLASEFGSENKAKEIKKDIKNGRLYVSPAPAPPISNVSREESDRINIEAAKKAPVTSGPSDNGGVEQYPIRAGLAALESAKSGVAQARQGLGEALSNQPVTGLKDIALGAGGVLGAPIEGISQLAGDVTGSKDIADRASLVAGSALPIDMGVGKAKALIPSNQAFKTLVESIGPENVGKVASEMRANPRLSPIDLSPKVLQDTQHLFVTDGPHINYLANAVDSRLQSAKNSVEDAFTGTMGTAVNPAVKLKQLSDSIKAVGAKEINPVLKATKPVDLTPVIEHIDNQLKPGVNAVISNPESMLPYDKVQRLLQGWKDQITNDKGVVLTNPDVLNKIQSNIRRQAETLMRTPDAESKGMGYALFQLRNKMIEAVGKAGPQTVDKEGKAISSYRAGLNKYKDENDINTAFEHGHDAIIKNSRNLEDHPAFFKNWVDQATKGEKEAAREGARVAIDTQINGFKSAARRGTDVGQSDFNHQRIEALFGKEDANKLFKKLEDERTIADRNAKLVQGSQTAMRAASKSRFELPTVSEVGKGLIPPAILEGANMLSGGPGGAATALYGALRGGAAVKDAIAMKLAKEHNASYAKLALPVEAPAREELIKSLEAVANRQKPSMLSRANNVARLFGP